ncbi:MAG: hypothetical protein ACYDA8_12150 [Deferrisomatales bacterium]
MGPRGRRIAGAVLLVLIQGPVAEALEGGEPLSDRELEELRGGFVSLEGVRMAFGMDRMVLVGGALEARTSLWVDDVGLASGLTQLGGLLSGVPAVLQNARDGETIQVLTRVDLTLSGLHSPSSRFRLDPPLRP